MSGETRERSGIRDLAFELKDLSAIEEIERPRTRPRGRGRCCRELTKVSSVSPAFEEDRLVGYVIVSRYVDAWHVDIDVHPQRRAGDANLLLERLSRRRRTTCGAGTPRGAGLEQARDPVYERYGFKRRGVRRGYYTDNREDALIIETRSRAGRLVGSSPSRRP